MHSPTDFIDEQRNADILDALSDFAYEQEQAMHESVPEEWLGYEQSDEPLATLYF
jgi:hypothetical protein